MDDSTSTARVPFSDEQYTRLQALLGVSPLLREKNSVFGGPTGGVAPAVTDIIELADYVITGIPFSVRAAALHDAMNPPMVVDGLSFLLGTWQEGKPYEGGPDLEEGSAGGESDAQETSLFD